MPLNQSKHFVSAFSTSFNSIDMHYRSNQSLFRILFVAAFCSFLGCGGGGPAIIPSSELTEEQKAAIKAADAEVDNEESQGKNPANKKKK